MLKRALAAVLMTGAVAIPAGSADAARQACEPVCEAVCDVVSSGACDIGILCINERPIIEWCAWDTPTILPADSFGG